ncbi:MAG: septation protein A [Alphaproteobacteria bacterium]
MNDKSDPGHDPGRHTPADRPVRTVSSGRRLALDLGPLAVFFIVFQMSGLFAATAAFMVAVSLALGLTWLATRRIAVTPLVTGIVVIVMGGLTLALDSEVFIKLKPTLVNLAFAMVLLGGYGLGRSPIRVVLDSALSLDDAGWRHLTLRWGLFFLFLAALNEAVWRSQTTEIWVSFKVFGMLPLTLAFAVAQARLVMRHRTDGRTRP